MPTRKWEDLRAGVASRPGATERIEAAKAELEAEIMAFDAGRGGTDVATTFDETA